MNTDAWLTALPLTPDAESMGDPVGELAAARDRSIKVPLADLGLIRLSGEDAVPFLHNLVTNDIKALDGTHACRAGLCTPKGRLLALFLVWRTGNDLFLVLPRDQLATIQKKLSMYVLRSKVKLADASQDWALIGTTGGEDAPAMSVSTGGDFTRLHLGQGRSICLVSSASVDSLWAKLPGIPAGLGAWRWLEIRCGEPRVVAATQEAFVPQMLNLELPAVAGVSFTKGCYPGQEIVARTQYLGKIKRRTFRAATSEIMAPGTPLYAAETGDQSCGAVVSCAPSPEGGFESLVCAQIGAVEGGDVRAGSRQGLALEFRPLPYVVD